MYCGNDPINRIDPSGKFAITTALIAVGIGALIGGTVSAGIETGKQLIANGGDWGKLDFKSIGIRALGGAVAGAISAIPNPFSGIAGYAFAFGTGAVASLAGGVVSGTVTNVSSAITSLLVGGAASMIAYGVSNTILNAKSNAIVKQGNKAKSLAVQKLQSNRLNMGEIALKGRYNNAFKGATQAEIAGLIKNANAMFRYDVFSSSISAFISEVG